MTFLPSSEQGASRLATPLLIITVRPGRNGQDDAECVWNGKGYEADSGSGVEMKIARVLVAADAPDQPWRTVLPDGRASMSGKSLHRLAMLTVNNTTGRLASWKGVDFTKNGGVVTKRCGGCSETGYVFEKVCLACATRAAHGGLTPTQRVKTRATGNRPNGATPGSATAPESAGEGVSSQAA